MALLKRASKETLQELGFNFSTAVKATLNLLIWIVAAAALSELATDSVKNIILWWIQLLAGLISVMIVFALLLGWNVIKAAQIERSRQAHRRMAADISDFKDERIKCFLRNALDIPSYGIEQCYAFGSVVRQDPTRDVDIIVQFGSSHQGTVRKCRERIIDVERTFHEFYDLKLHVQTFTSSERESLRSFLDKAGTHERLI